MTLTKRCISKPMWSYITSSNSESSSLYIRKDSLHSWRIVQVAMEPLQNFFFVSLIQINFVSQIQADFIIKVHEKILIDDLITFSYIFFIASFPLLLQPIGSIVEQRRWWWIVEVYNCRWFCQNALFNLIWKCGQSKPNVY